MVFTVLPRTAPASPMRFISRATWRRDGLTLKLPPDLAHAIDLEVSRPKFALCRFAARHRLARRILRIGALRRVGLVGAWGEGGKGSTCIAGGKPAEGIGKTRQIGSTL